VTNLTQPERVSGPIPWVTPESTIYKDLRAEVFCHSLKGTGESFQALAWYTTQHRQAKPLFRKDFDLSKATLNMSSFLPPC